MTLTSRPGVRLARATLLAVGALALPGCSRDSLSRSDFNELPLETPLDPSRGPPNGATGSDPARLVLDVVGAGAELPPHQRLEITFASGESKTAAVAVFSEVGLSDDSVRGIRYRVELSRPQRGDPWRIDWVGSQFSCWPGRGHQSWRKEPCV